MAMPLPQIMDEIKEVINRQFASSDLFLGDFLEHACQTQVPGGAGITWESDSLPTHVYVMSLWSYTSSGSLCLHQLFKVQARVWSGSPRRDTTLRTPLSVLKTFFPTNAAAHGARSLG